MKSPGPFLFALFAVALLAGCSPRPRPAVPAKASANSDAAFSAPTQLTALSTNGNNIIVTWKNNATVDGGVWVEYTTPGDPDYIQLDEFASDSGETSFFHPNLPPQTTLLYRLEPFFGSPTKPLNITTGVAATNEASLPTGPIAPTNNVALDHHQKFSIRSMSTFTRATPSNLTATLSSPTSVEIRWKDCAEDEDGYLLEISASPDGAFVPCALLPPNSTSFRKSGLPPSTACYFRVRAFFWGKPTEPVTARTP